MLDPHTAQWAATLGLRPAATSRGCIRPLLGKHCSRPSGKLCTCSSLPRVWDHVEMWTHTESGTKVLVLQPYDFRDRDAVELEAYLTPLGLSFGVGREFTGTWARTAQLRVGEPVWTTPIAISADAALARRVARHDEPLRQMSA